MVLKAILPGTQRLSSHAPSLGWKAMSVIITVQLDFGMYRCFTDRAAMQYAVLEVCTFVQELYLWESVADAGRHAIKMRYQLLPHLYTAFHQANEQGTPVAKPLWFAFPQDAATHAIDDQWLLGEVLISPVLHQVCCSSGGSKCTFQHCLGSCSALGLLPG